jgi:glycerophosphoryl diester phosphodiesterase
MRKLIGLAALLFGLAAAAQTTIDLQGHRGARGLLPENTLPGFALALKLGVTTLELDLAVTRDGVLVISHDPALNPDITRDAQGSFLRATGPNIIDLTFEQLAQFDVGRINPWSQYAKTFSSQRAVDGTRIPRLADLLRMVRESGNEQVRFAIETKLTPHRPEQTPDPETFVRLLLKEIDDAGLAAERVQILSFDWRTLQIVQRDRPKVATVYLTIQAKNFDNVMAGSGGNSPWNAGFTFARHGSIPRMIKAAGGTHWSSNWRELNAGNVAEAKGLGLKVLAWTVNDRETMQSMLDLGVDGLVTDRPDIAIELLRDRKIGW